MTMPTLTCPGCTTRLELDEPALEATIDHGCPLCGGSISEQNVMSY
ncbi:zinc ribbon domain-containing protein [Salinadaptatus halalkaliphilus]|uniref:Zinc ribbon domain-containing protein n=1 Tax=Salinadaptatus halalkaliphilus TaxID=2419781 RepID=A0A4S3TR08_9EURY|nr:zinc ribbon domain-containing protein [Salinadaptatus halalkaliphilus]THE66842.1 zinc ribbon domain-containing protein [Salinadaptatus halalkaliphilus]